MSRCDEARTLRAAGFTYREIGIAMDVSPPRARQLAMRPIPPALTPEQRYIGSVLKLVARSLKCRQTCARTRNSINPKRTLVRRRKVPTIHINLPSTLGGSR